MNLINIDKNKQMRYAIHQLNTIELSTNGLQINSASNIGAKLVAPSGKVNHLSVFTEYQIVKINFQAVEIGIL